MDGASSLPQIDLTAEDRQKIRTLAAKTDLTDRGTILTYGTAPQRKPAALAEKMLEMVTADDFAEMEGKLTALLISLRQCLPEERKKGFLGRLTQILFGGRKRLKKRISRTVEELRSVTGELEDHRNRLLRDHVMLGRLSDSVTEQVRELTVYIKAGEEILASGSGTKEERKSFERRLHDLRLTCTVSLQMLPQIRLLMDANIALSDKIRAFLDDTVPLWMNRMTITLGIERSGDGAAADMMAGLDDLLRSEQDGREAREELEAELRQTGSAVGGI